MGKKRLPKVQRNLNRKTYTDSLEKKYNIEVKFISFNSIYPQLFFLNFTLKVHNIFMVFVSKRSNSIYTHSFLLSPTSCQTIVCLSILVITQLYYIFYKITIKFTKNLQYCCIKFTKNLHLTHKVYIPSTLHPQPKGEKFTFNRQIMYLLLLINT